MSPAGATPIPIAAQSPEAAALRPRWSQIEGLRALAASSVFVLHAWVILGMAFASAELILPAARADDLFGHSLSKFILASIGHLGATGVSLFYAISGFLLYQPFLRARQRGEHLALGPYLVRRAARIIPAYWLALTVIALAEGTGDVFTWHGFVDYYLFGEIWTTLNIEHLTHARAWTSNPLKLADGQAYFVLAGNPIQVAWTLCVEVSFYIFLPVWSWLIAKAVDSRRNPVRAEIGVLLAVAAASLAWQIWALTRVPNVEFEPWLMILPSSIDIFAAGMILAALSTVAGERGWPRLIRSAGSRAWAWWLSAGVIYTVLAFLESKYDTDMNRTWWHYLYGDFLHKDRMFWVCAYLVIAFLVLAPAVVGDASPGRIARFLNWKVTAWVGLVSYGLYLWHVWILEKVKEVAINLFGADPKVFVESPRLWFVPIGFVLAYLLALGAASISWYGLERRVLAAAHRLPLARRERG